MEKKTAILGMICSTILLSLAAPYSSGQHYLSRYKHKIPALENDTLFHYYVSYGVEVKDSSGGTLFMSDPYFSQVYIPDSTSSHFVGLLAPYVDKEYYRYYSNYNRNYIYACYDDSLKVKFVFPVNTTDIECRNTFYYYTTHWTIEFKHCYKRGAIGLDGQIIVPEEHDLLFDHNNSLISFDFGKGNHKDKCTLSLYHVNNALGSRSFSVLVPTKYVSAVEYDWEEYRNIREMREDITEQENNFNNALFALLHLEIDKAVNYFKEAKNGPDKEITKASIRNLKTIARNYKTICQFL